MQKLQLAKIFNSKQSRFIFPILTLLLCLQACEEGFSGDASDTDGSEQAPNVFTQANDAALENYYATPIAVSGQVLDANGLAIAAAQVSLSGQTVQSDAQGNYAFSGLNRANVLLTITANGYHDERLAIALNHPLTLNELSLPATILSSQSNLTRLVFGGDTAFARRYLDPLGVTPLTEVPIDNPDALILASNPQPGTQNVLQWIKPHFENADFSIVNFETPITNNPVDPHPTKAFVFFTLPESIPGLQWMGVDYVSMGNNHVYDYLETGLADTISNLNAYDMKHSGAGFTVAEAFAPYRTDIKNHPYSFISANSVSGFQHEITYVADETKGGAADLRSSIDLENTITAELLAGNSPILQLHTGKEYTFEPSSIALNRLNLAAELGADLIVAHHPHVAQGVGIHNGVYQIQGLGNLAFDQARLETMLGLIARVDMDKSNVQQIRLIPAYVKDFRPRLIGGDIANQFLRRIGEFSIPYDMSVYPYHGQAWVMQNTPSPNLEIETIQHSVTIDESGQAIIDLRQLIDSEYSLKRINFANGLEMQLGRDILHFGDMEDWDLDEVTYEAARWDVSSGSTFECFSEKFRGINSVCSTRSGSNLSDSVTAFRNRTRVMGDADDEPNKSLSLLAYIKGSNAGELNIISRYFASFGDLEFGEEVAITHAAGTYDWKAVTAELSMPADEPVDAGQFLGEFNARALRIFVRHSPPVSDDGLLAFDDVAVINWEESVLSNALIVTPHARDFIRAQGAPGQYSIELEAVRFVP